MAIKLNFFPPYKNPIHRESLIPFKPFYIDIFVANCVGFKEIKKNDFKKLISIKMIADGVCYFILYNSI